MKKVAFHTPALDVRGTNISVYDYAHFNEVLLKNKSIVIVPKSSIDKNLNDIEAVIKFQNRFTVIFYTTIDDMDNKLVSNNCDVMYCIKYGVNDGIFSSKIKTVIHCVFDMSQRHGDVYAGVSHQLVEKYNERLYVPHMISLEPSIQSNDNLRGRLCISKDAIVFGRIGGETTFDIPFVKEAIRKLVRINPNIYFLFISTEPFDNHTNVVFFPKTADPIVKSRFINTCDAMIHAQFLGETFGIAIGEFSVNNKPIICYGGSVFNDNYKRILKDKAIYYTNQDNLLDILYNFKKEDFINKDLNCYKEFSPENVMTKFKEVFLD
jgi:hypothetical protein